MECNPSSAIDIQENVWQLISKDYVAKQQDCNETLIKLMEHFEYRDFYKNFLSVFQETRKGVNSNAQKIQMTRSQPFCFIHLPLEATGSSSLKKKLDIYFGESEVTQSQLYTGLQWNTVEKQHEQVLICEPADIFIIFFHRAMENNIKSEETITFTSTLDLAPYSVDKTVYIDPYLLYAIIVHHGDTPESGHYSVFIRIPNYTNRLIYEAGETTGFEGEWFWFNDEEVEKVVMTDKIMKKIKSCCASFIYLNKSRAGNLMGNQSFVKSNPKLRLLKFLEEKNVEPAVFFPAVGKKTNEFALQHYLYSNANAEGKTIISHAFQNSYFNSQKKAIPPEAFQRINEQLKSTCFHNLNSFLYFHFIRETIC
jgi:hypothetical protein